MESFNDYSTSTNVLKQSPIVLCQESFASCEDSVTGSEFFFVTSDQIAIDQTLVVQKTMVLKERILVSRFQNESAVAQPIIPQSDAVGQVIIPQSSAIIFPQNENFTDEIEMSSQTSLMELCSQESAEKMDAYSQESIMSKMDLASQENVLIVEDCVPIDSEALQMNEARSLEGNISHKTDLKRKHAISSTGEILDVKDADILLRQGNVGFNEPNESSQDRVTTDFFENHTLPYNGKNTKRFKK